MVYCALHKRFCGPGDLAPPSLLSLVLSYWFFQGKPSLEKVEPGATPPRPPPGGGRPLITPMNCLFIQLSPAWAGRWLLSLISASQAGSSPLCLPSAEGERKGSPLAPGQSFPQITPLTRGPRLTPWISGD